MTIQLGLHVMHFCVNAFMCEWMCLLELDEDMIWVSFAMTDALYKSWNAWCVKTSQPMTIRSKCHIPCNSIGIAWTSYLLECIHVWIIVPAGSRKGYDLSWFLLRLMHCIRPEVHHVWKYHNWWQIVWNVIDCDNSIGIACNAYLRDCIQVGMNVPAGSR